METVMIRPLLRRTGVTLMLLCAGLTATVVAQTPETAAVAAQSRGRDPRGQRTALGDRGGARPHPRGRAATLHRVGTS